MENFINFFFEKFKLVSVNLIVLGFFFVKLSRLIKLFIW